MPAPSAGMTEERVIQFNRDVLELTFECELLHVRSNAALLCWRGHRAIGDDGRCPTIARLGVSSLDLASPGSTGGALFAKKSRAGLAGARHLAGG